MSQRPQGRHRIIIDTDPVCATLMHRINWANAKLRLMQGVDDILAMLLAFSAKADELEVLLVSVTFGNVAVER
jgi:inosine-uridine nucleoside N-ribohydrolase